MDYKLSFEQFQEGLKSGRFLGLKCDRCGCYTFPPQAVCRNCQSRDLQMVQLRGKGTIRTFTVIRVAPEGMRAPYVVAMVEMEEGPWIVGNVLGLDPDQAELGLISRKVKLGSRPVPGNNASEEGAHVLTFELI